MARVTATEVQEIVETDGSGLTPYITWANLLVTAVCAPALAADKVTPLYSDPWLKEIERLLAAHFYCVYDPRAQRERVAVLTFEAQSKVDLCLDVTHYGQQAKVMDINGGLARLDAMAKGGKGLIKVNGQAIWMGTKPCELPLTPEC